MRRAKRRVATSTRRQTATSTRTLGTAGSRLRGLALIPRETAWLLREDGDRNKRVLGRRPSVGAAGSPGRRVLVVLEAAEEEVGVVEAVVGGNDVQLQVNERIQ